MQVGNFEVTRKKIISGVLAVFALITLLLSFFTVKEYQRDVVTRWGEFSRVAGPGPNFKIPFVESTRTYRTDILSLSVDKPVNTYTVDNQEVDIVFTVFYRVPADNVEFVYRNAQDYRNRLFDTALNRLKSQMGGVSVATVAEKRGEISAAIKEALAADARTLGVIVTDFQLTNIEYTKAYRAEVEKAAAARQVVTTRTHEKEQEIEVAEKARVTAAGVADAKILTATADAKAITLRGDAEASAIRAKADALRQNMNLVELTKAERWDGALPTQMLSGVVPFMNYNAPGSPK